MSVPSPAKQTEQKIASAEGAAAQLGAAPAPLDLLRIGGPGSLPPGPSLVEALGGALAPSTPAQPDARDAEIARLRRQIADMEQERGEVNQALKDEMQGAARLTKEPEEARADAGYAGGALVKEHAHRRAAEAQAKALREALEAEVAALTAQNHGRCDNCDAVLTFDGDEPAAEVNCDVCPALRQRRRAMHAALAPPEPKAETPAETAGQKEGLTALQSRVAAWVRLAFREEALTDRWERAARVVEEAIELGQAEGLDHEDVYRIWQRVYSRGAGDVEQEAGGVMVCLLAWAAGRETSLAACALREIERIEQPATVEKIRRKQAEKAKAGTGHDFAPPTPSAAQPSQDVAGTRGEILAGLSKEGSEP